MISRSSVRQEIMKPGRKKKKIKKVLGEFKRKKLKSSSGKKVTNRKQAIAIALNSKDKRRKS
jgi:hypothetical protein|tara:strand:+ start:388 stop:573 length:186 start_codon:yes stop_codon:yes gene_type:complete